MKVCSKHSIVQYVDYMRGAHQRGGAGAVAPFAPFKIHHWVEGTMASADITLACGLNFQVGCQDRLHVNSDADETLA